ncbi:lycopene cyclase family protein [Sorangium sp. So ce834]|uniref:lycopene cyclase family protein n=1 Tax=Sorangium sp. So ce834 TaxID=3133321 RepID=UPI003F60B28F
MGVRQPPRGGGAGARPSRRAPPALRRLEIEAEAPLFDTGAATLFDFAGAAGHGGDARFYYVIPFTPQRALVELVALGGEAHEEELARYVERTAGGARFRVVRRERGASLLTCAPFARRLGRRVLAIGVAGGLLKPSTGYAFTRILDDAALIVRSLETAGHPFARPPRGLPYRFFDAVFLRLLAAQPSRIEPVLTALFTRNPVDRVLRFLDERASLADVLAIVASLPKLPFLRALAGWLGTRLGLVPPARQLRA